MRRTIGWWVSLAALVLLAGCAGRYMLDNSVQTFSRLAAPPAQPTYRYDRLPSQQDPAQAQLEAMADEALRKAGWRRDEAGARYTVQATARLVRVASPWGWQGGWGSFGYAHHGVGLMAGFPLMDTPWHQREVMLIIRELPSTAVVYETRATNSGPWLDPAVVFPAMFDAALQGFPSPPAGARQVDILLGGKAS